MIFDRCAAAVLNETPSSSAISFVVLPLAIRISTCAWRAVKANLVRTATADDSNIATPLTWNFSVNDHSGGPEGLEKTPRFCSISIGRKQAVQATAATSAS